MKCISLWQPWATLIAIGAKRIETRGWSTDYRGPLAIHAAKKWTRKMHEMACSEPFVSVLAAADIGSIPLGCIVAVGELVGVIRTEHLRGPQPIDGGVTVNSGLHQWRVTDDEIAFGNYGAGRFAWLLADMKPLTVTVPFKGRQGLFEIPDKLLKGAA